MDIDIKQIRELMRAMKQLEVNELEIEANEERIYLRRGGAQSGIGMSPTMLHSGPGTLPPPAPLPSEAPSHAAAGVAAAKDDPNVIFITSPFVGTFYRSPAPDAPVFVEDGEKISAGQVLCIVEAMKLMNEIESEVSGTILEVLVENGKPVEYGDELFKVKKSG